MAFKLYPGTLSSVCNTSSTSVAPKLRYQQNKSKRKKPHPASRYLELEAVVEDKCSDDENEENSNSSDDDYMTGDGDDETSDDETGDSDDETGDDEYRDKVKSSNLTKKEKKELQPDLWFKTKKIVIRRKSSKSPLNDKYDKAVGFQFSVDRSCWIFCFFIEKNNTIIHAFLLKSLSLPDEFNISDAERLDSKIIIEEPLEVWDKLKTFNIISFVMYKQNCAQAFIEMLFKTNPKLTKLLYPSSHEGLESAIRKVVFDYSKGKYFKKRIG